MVFPQDVFNEFRVLGENHSFRPEVDGIRIAEFRDALYHSLNRIVDQPERTPVGVEK